MAKFDIVPIAALGLAAFIGLTLFNKPRPTPPVPPQSPGAATPTHIFDLGAAVPGLSTPGGSETIASADNSPILEIPVSQTLNHWAVSAGLLKLNPGGFLEPHWHPNCAEIGYVLSGFATMTIFVGDSTHESFILNPGEVFFVPKGFTHHIENIGPGGASMLLAWDNERPQRMGFSGSVGVSTPRVLNAVFDTSFWTGFQGSSKDVGIPQKATIGLDPLQIPARVNQTFASAPPVSTDVNIDTTPDYLVSYASTMTLPTSTSVASVKSRPVEPKMRPVAPTSVYKLELERLPPAVDTPGGTTTKGNKAVFPVLNGLAVFSIILAPGGIREPHWHPNAGELHYIASGQSKFFVESPGGQTENGTVTQGQFFYAPPGFWHYFENTGAGPLHLVAVFTSEDPQDVGLSGGLSAYSNNVLGATLNLPPAAFNLLPHFRKDEGLVAGL